MSDPPEQRRDAGQSGEGRRGERQRSQAAGTRETARPCRDGKGLATRSRSCGPSGPDRFAFGSRPRRRASPGCRAARGCQFCRSVRGDRFRARLRAVSRILDRTQESGGWDDLVEGQPKSSVSREMTLAARFAGEARAGSPARIAPAGAFLLPGRMVGRLARAATGRVRSTEGRTARTISESCFALLSPRTGVRAGL